jgi:16S rRNA (uracil1498-N3)-methyltransferase
LVEIDRASISSIGSSAMSERFFVDSPITTEQAILHGPEAHHLLHVMRAKVGEEVTLFDGSGSEFAARVTHLGKAQVELQVVGSQEVNRESSIELTLAMALPKGDRQRWLVEKAVELGVTRIVPLTTKRGVAEASASALDRLRRTVIEASKQCGRNQLLEISDPQDWRQAVQALAPECWRILADPGGKPLGAFWPPSEKTAPSPPIVAAVGPEGGFTDEEINLAQSANWTRVSLGPRILRVETAALAIAAWVAASTDEKQSHRSQP